MSLVYQMTTSREQARVEGHCRVANVPQRQAIRHGISRKGPWHMAKTIASGVGMTNNWLSSQGVLSLKTLWAKLAHLRGTA
jgi:RNA-directed DNA polymerase